MQDFVPLDAFAAAACPAPAKCMGRRLLPLTVGHCIMFHRIDLSWLRARDAGITDLIAGVSICSRTWGECVHWFQSPPSTLRLRAWTTECRYRYGLTTGDWSPLNFLQSQAVKFREYIAGSLDNRNWPDFIPRRGGFDSETVGDQTPADAMLVASLMCELGMSWIEAVETPYALARWLISANAARCGAGKTLLRDSDTFAAHKAALAEINGLTAVTRN